MSIATTAYDRLTRADSPHRRRASSCPAPSRSTSRTRSRRRPAASRCSSASIGAATRAPRTRRMPPDDRAIAHRPRTVQRRLRPAEPLPHREAPLQPPRHEQHTTTHTSCKCTAQRTAQVEQRDRTPVDLHLDRRRRRTAEHDDDAERREGEQEHERRRRGAPRATAAARSRCATRSPASPPACARLRVALARRGAPTARRPRARRPRG